MLDLLNKVIYVGQVDIIKRRGSKYGKVYDNISNRRHLEQVSDKLLYKQE